MCLLVVVSRLDAELPLVVAANRDERLDRPAVAMTVLRERNPRILGGRDLRAGGTWLAVNEHGVVAGLTNTPSPAGRDDTKKSRGALPLVAAAHQSAAEAVEALVADIHPEEYNPAWMLVGDRRSLFAVTVAGERPTATALPPGVHVLENRPPGYESLKVDHVLELLGPASALPRTADGLVGHLHRVLADHTLPPGDLEAVLEAEAAARAARATGHARRASTERDGAQPDGAQPDGAQPDGAGPAPPAKPPVEVFAACVHSESYGTRSAAIVQVVADDSARPAVLAADGPSCQFPLRDRSALWHGPSLADAALADAVPADAVPADAVPADAALAEPSPDEP